MEILKILGVGIITTITYIVVKQIKPEFSSLILIAGSCLILCFIVGYIADIVQVVDKILIPLYNSLVKDTQVLTK